MKNLFKQLKAAVIKEMLLRFATVVVIAKAIVSFIGCLNYSNQLKEIAGCVALYIVGIVCWQLANEQRQLQIILQRRICRAKKRREAQKAA